MISPSPRHFPISTPIWMSALGHHQRYDYHGPNDLPDYRWPGGKRLAVYVAMNLEHFSFGCQEGAQLAPVANKLDVLNYSWRDYGNRVGGWHLADLFQRLGLPASVICNTSILDYCPNVALLTGFSLDWLSSTRQYQQSLRR
ncbi:hypothetical protein ACL9RG_04655 [Rouxiella sp. Mn2063]